MAQGASSYPQMADAVVVVSQKFCAPYPVDLIMVKNFISIKDGNFKVIDINGQIIFKVKEKFLTIHDRRVLYDSHGNPIISLRQKILSAHKRWQVFRGDSSENKDLLFTAKRPSLVQFRTELDVFLGANSSTRSHGYDFKVIGSWLEKTCTIYTGHSSTIIAQMHKTQNVGSKVFGKDSFGVIVYPNVDCAFIVALLIILNEVSDD